MGFVFPPHVPEDHRQVLFANLGPEYGAEEEQRKVELWLSVAVDECVSCAQRLVWLLAKDVGAVVALARVFKLLVTFEPPPEEHSGQLLEVTRLMSVEDRAEMVVDIANDFSAKRGGPHLGHGPECEDCAARRGRWKDVERRVA
jgi:hypothetical protein